MIEERLRTLAGEVRVEVRGDVAARIAHHVRVVRKRRQVAVAAVSGVAVTAAVPVLATIGGESRGVTTPPTTTTSATVAPTPTGGDGGPTLPGSGISASLATQVLDECGEHGEFPDDAQVKVYERDGIGATALIGNADITYACIYHKLEVERVDPEPFHCKVSDLGSGTLGPGGLDAAGVSATKDDNSARASQFWHSYGCVRPGIVRVQMLLPTNQSFEAFVANGVFVWRRPTEWTRGGDVFDTTAPDWAAYAILGIRAYDADGNVVIDRPVVQLQLTEEYMSGQPG